MLFIVMHKTNQQIEDDCAPDKTLVANMGQLIAETIAAGRFHDAAGLRGSAMRVRLRFAAGDRTRQKGPLRGENELVAAMVMLKVNSMDEAENWSTRIAEATGAAEIEIGPVTEAWDIGVAPKPEGVVPLRVLALTKADASSEAGTPPAPERASRMAALIEEMKRAGVFLMTESLQPSSGAARLRASSGKHSWTDGPFAESKELVAGFTIIKADSKSEAMAWATRYADVLGDCEVDVRRVVET
jgi:hypothetical protein